MTMDLGRAKVYHIILCLLDLPLARISCILAQRNMANVGDDADDLFGEALGVEEASIAKGREDGIR